MTPIRYLLLPLFLCLVAGVHRVQAQCSANAVVTDVSCSGQSNGSIDLSAANGTAPYTYAWSNNQTNEDLAGLPAGTYTCTVTDALSCTASVSATVTQPAPLSVSAIGGTLTCVTQSLVIQAIATGGTLPYTYLWSNGITTANPVISAPGTYTVSVTDAHGCTSSAQAVVDIDVQVPVTCVAPADILTCSANTVTLNGSCSSGGPNFIYLWVGPGIIGPWNTPTILVNQPGAYSLIVTNIVNNCTSEATTFVLQDQAPPVANAGPDLLLTCVTPTVTLDGSGSSSGAPIFYQWTTPDGNITGGQGTLHPVVDAPGYYSLEVTNAQNGCTATDNVVVISDYVIPIADAGPDTGIPCGGNTVTLDASGSSIGPNWTIQWSGPAITPGNQFSLTPTVTAPGFYSLLVTNTNNGCTATDDVLVFGGPAIPQQSVVVNHGSCLPSSGAIDLTFSDGPAPYSYLWSNGATTEDLNNLIPGTYSVTLTDATSCIHYAVIIVPQDPLLSIFPISNSPTNCATPNAWINLLVSGGVAPYSYIWSNGATIKDLTGLLSGVYTVTVTDVLGCTKVDTIPLFTDLGINSVVVPVQCFGSNTGSINLNILNGIAPYTYQWSGPNGFTSTLEDPTGLFSGTYWVTVTDINGCVGAKIHTVTQPTNVFFGTGVSKTSCFGSSDGSATCNISGAPAPYIYLWSTGQTTQTITGLFAGFYSLTLTDSNGCTYIDNNVEVRQPDEIVVNFQTLSNNCDGAVIAPIVSGGTAIPFYHFFWSNGAQDSVFQVFSTGDYTLTVTDDNGCTATSTYSIQVNSGLCGLLKGRVYQDVVENCLEDGEPGLGGWIMQAQGTNGTFFGVTNANGNYAIGVLPGDYTVLITPANPLWHPCSSSLSANAVGVNDTLGGFDFPVKKDVNCPALSVDITSSNLRRCFSSNYYSVKYCNSGTDKAFDAYVLLTLDAFIIPLSSTLPYTNLGSGVIRFEVGDLEIGDCRSFVLYFKLDCNAVLGQTHCTEAHIYPDESCIPPDVQWSGASLHVSSECQPDSVRFRIENVGTGNMPNMLDYIVIEDQVMLMSAPVQLNAGAFTTVSVPANGSTWRLEVEQEPFHPGASRPSVSVEGCTTGATFSTGFITQFPADDVDEFIDIDCKENVASSDPNDKQAFPIGYGAQHYIRPGTPLEYQIRFQNTGNDTAFTVRIVDTLSAWLSPATIRPGASSHPYQWDLNGEGVITFLFENILLPDSNVNEAGSHGFVKFSIDPSADAPLETVIENTAEIYFDYNDAVVTNTTYHRLGENFVTVGLWEPVQPGYAVLVSPNPFSDAANLEVKGLKQTIPLHLEVFDLQGNLQCMMDAEGPVFQLKKGHLPAGVYLFKIDHEGANIGSGKLMIQD